MNKNRFLDQSFNRHQIDRQPSFDVRYPLGIRYSPYQSPFVPSSPKGVYWIGAEYRDMPHNAHVYAWVQEQGRRHVEWMASLPVVPFRDEEQLIADRAARHLEYASAVDLLPLLDEMAGEGVKASARRALDVRAFLSPHKRFSPPDFKVAAKRSIARQRQERGV